MKCKRKALHILYVSIFGIDTSDYSFGYVAGWSSGKETAELKAPLEVIRTTADEMITDISEKLKELEKGKIR